MNKKILIFSLTLTSLLGSVSAQSGIFPGDPGQGGAISGILGSAIQVLAEMLMFPETGRAGAIMIWFSGIVLTVYAAKVAVQNFDTAVGGWLPNTPRDYYVVGLPLAGIFIGGTNFLGWISDITWILIIGGAALVIGIMIRTIILGGSFVGGNILSGVHKIRTGFVGTHLSGAANTVAAWAGGRVQNLWNEYRDISRCDANGHLNPQPAPGGGGGPFDCWVDGCGGDWTP